MSKPNQPVRQTEPYSVVNARILQAACAECTVSRDWKTFHNWQSQGMRVRKGQHGVKIIDLQWQETDDQDDETTGHEFWKLVPVFCRHQVSKISRKGTNDQKTDKVERD